MEFSRKYGPWAIIAGGSEGIGRSIALELARRGLSILLIARDGPLDEVAYEVRRTGAECPTARIDLASPDALDRIVEAAAGCEVGLYVANAGGDASASRFLDYDLAYWLALARVNMVTTMQACHHFGLGMRERERGGFLLMNSGGAYGGSSFLATYNACKSFLLTFAEGLWAELRPYGVDVLTIALNSTDTPGFHRILARTGMSAPATMAHPDHVAELALERLPHGPVHNWGLADDEAGFALTSAAARRARVLEMDHVTARIYGGRRD